MPALHIVLCESRHYIKASAIIIFSLSLIFFELKVDIQL